MPDKEQQAPEPEPKPRPDDQVSPDTSDPRLISRVQEADEPDPRLISWSQKAQDVERASEQSRDEG